MEAHISLEPGARAAAEGGEANTSIQAVAADADVVMVDSICRRSIADNAVDD